MIDIAEIIRAQMRKKNMSVTELAEKCEISQSNLSNNLRSGNMTLPVIERCAKGLGMTVIELLATPEEIEAERQRRRMMLASMYVKSTCPCCGNEVCVKLSISRS